MAPFYRRVALQAIAGHIVRSLHDCAMLPEAR